ncbi:MAG: amidohydrolase family protein [Candidatus Latescibacteria bacterium]|nr:amidohydrolase family protein [Candidatus Latescibacterota bacterium]
MRIDAHMHVNYQGMDAGSLVSEMDAYGIDLAWLLTWYLPPGQDAPRFGGGFSPLNYRPDGTHAGATLDHILAACDRYPGRFIAGYCPCPYEGSAADLFESAWRMHGVRVCGEWSYRLQLDDPRSIQLFRRAGELGAPVVLHLDVPFLPDDNGNPTYQNHWCGGDVGNLERALQACPNTVFIGHAPGFWRYISGDAATSPESYPSGPVAPGGELHSLLDNHPNLFADLSSGSGLNALRRDPEHARDFLIHRADRLLYGRDNTGNELQEFLPSLDLPRAVLDRIYFKNAASLVSIDPE